MNSNLVKKLIEKGAIRQGTVFEAYYDAYGLSCVNNSKISGEFILIAAKAAKDGSIVFEAMGEGNVSRRVPSTDVIKMDGMEIERMAEIYNLAECGSDVTVSAKRRGRKPKVREAECE